jgi:hypothetical protein
MTRSLKMGLLAVAILGVMTAAVAVVTLVDLDGPTAEESEPGGLGSAAMGEYLQSIVDPLRQAAIDHGHDPAEFLPSDAEIEAAVSSGSPDSAEGVVVMELLRESYVFFRMKFPGPPSGGGAGEGPVSSDRIDASDRAAALRPWFELRVEELRAEAEAQDASAELWIPSPQELELAAGSGSLDSPESLRVISRLRDGFSQLGLELQAPL